MACSVAAGRRLIDHPGAYWIWAPGITGDTPNASLAEYSFNQKFDLAGTPISGSISVAVDDMAQVYVNGILAGTTGSITNVGVAFQAQSELKSIDLTPFLVSGTNTIEVSGAERPGLVRRGYRRRLPAEHGGCRFRRHAELPVRARAFQHRPSRSGLPRFLALRPENEGSEAGESHPADRLRGTGCRVNRLANRGCH